MKKIICGLLLLSALLWLTPFAQAQEVPTVVGDQLQQSLSDLINKSVAIAGDALAFTKAELPDVIHQLLVWKASESLFYLLLSLPLMYTCVLLYRWGKSQRKLRPGRTDIYESNLFYDIHGDPVPGWLFIFLYWLIAGGVGLSMFCHNSVRIVQILVAPKIYLIEYAAKMVS